MATQGNNLWTHVRRSPDSDRMVPTRRRVYVRNPDGSPIRDSVSVAIDVAHVAFS